MVTAKSIQKTVDQYEQYIQDKGTNRGFTRKEIRALFTAAKEAGPETNQLWNMVLYALMYGYMKGYKRAVKDCREDEKAPGTAATDQGAGSGTAATINRKK